MSIRSVLVFYLLGLPLIAGAHHAVSGNYDTSRVIEVEGEVVDILWRNPHVQVSLRVTDDSGNPQDWRMSTTSLSNLRRWQIDASFIEVGETISVAGYPAIRTDYGLYIRNVLTSAGDEVLLGGNVQPVWTGDRIIEMVESRRLGIGDTSAPDLGIFRVWSTPPGIPTLIPRDMGITAEGRANLTPSALQAVDAFVWERDTLLRNCAPKGMPLIMHAPYPSQFVRDGENIVWHNEEYDTIRMIHMVSDASSEGQPDSVLGYSVGRWEGERTLVVTTTHMNWGHLDGQGIPSSTSATAVERFVVTPEGDRLDYTMTYTDPENVIEPLTFRKHWVYYADAVVNAYDCLEAAED